MFARRQAVNPDRGTEAGGAYLRNWDTGELVSPARSPERNGLVAEVCVSDSGNTKTVFSRQPSLMSNRRCGALSFLLTQSRRFGSRCWVGRDSLNCNQKKEFDLRKQAPAQQTNRQTGFSFFFLSTCRRNGLTFSSPAADFSVLVCTTAVSGAVRFELFARAAPFFKPSDLRGCLFARGQVRTGSPLFSYCG